MTPRKVAVVNDDTQFLTMMEMILQDAGYDVMLLIEATDAFDQLRDWQPDLIILDIRIENPEAGWTILDLLRLDRTTEHTPVIVCSAAHDELQSKQEHLDRYDCTPLFKPFNIDDLLEMVAQQIPEAMSTNNA